MDTGLKVSEYFHSLNSKTPTSSKPGGLPGGESTLPTLRMKPFRFAEKSTDLFFSYESSI